MSEYVNYDGLKRYDELIKNVISVKTWIGSCSTAAGTAAKVISVENGFKLLKGVRIGVKFTATNTASNVTLNVNNTGAKSIYYNNAVFTGNSNMICGYANRYVFYVYDGTNWVWDGYGNHDNTSYSAMSTGELTTGTATNSRVVRSDYLKAGIKSIVEDYGYTTNTGTVTSVAVKMNGTTKGTVTTSGTIDLGTVITAHQDISGKVDKVTGKGLSTNDYTTDEKNKLSGIASGAEVNQNAFSNIGVKVGSTTTTVAADAKTDTVTLIQGSNITLTPDASNDTITIAATDTKYTAATSAPGKVATSSAQGSSTNYARQDHTHGIDLATGDSNGQVKIAGTNVSVKGLGSAAYTASTAYATNQQLASDANLNNIKTVGFYNAGGGNTITNKPSGVEHFGMEVIHYASGDYYVQIVYNNSSSWRRRCDNGTWGSWVQDKLTDTTYSSKAAASGGTDVSLVTTGEKATWNAKTSNTGTVTKVTAGTGLTGGDITTTGTIALATSGVTAGTYKRVTVDKYGRVTAGDNTDADSHWTTGINAGASGATSNSAVTNPYVTVKDNSTYRSQIQLKGGGATTVSSDANGVITITSTDNNTNTWKAANASQEGYVPKSTANKILRSDANGALYWGNDNNTTYTSKAAEANGTDVSLVTTGEKAIWNAKTSNTGTITGIKMNGASKGTSGVVDLGTVITSLNHTVTVQSGLKSDGTTTISGTSSSAGSPTVALGDSGVTAGTYKRVTVNAKGIVIGGDNSDSDTKNTAGTTNKTGTKMFLAAATELSANPVTYSNSNCYIGTDNCLYSGGSKVLTSYTNTTYAAGTGVTISGSNNAINVTYGSAAGTACQGNDSRLSNARPASDVSSWAKASTKPSYNYSEIGYTATETTSAGGAISIDGTTPLQVITISAAVSGITFSAVPENGHSCHLIITASSALSVAIAHGATMFTGYTSVCPSAEDVSLDITAGGYVELDLLRVGTKIYIRGV